MNRKAVIRIAVIAAVAALIAWLILRPPAPGTREMEGALRYRLAAPAPLHGTGTGIERRRAWAMVRAFYKDRGYRPAWTDINGPRPVAFEVLRLIRRADRDGLDPATYGLERLHSELDVVRGTWGPIPARAETLAWMDLGLTIALCRYAHDLRDGRFPRGLLDPDWGARPDSIGLATGLSRAASRHRLTAMVDTLAPPLFQYRALREELALQRAIAARGGWPSVPAGPTLARGATGKRVERLREHLAASGDVAGGPHDDVFDIALERAVRRFQNRHGLQVTGTVGAATLAALNVPIEERIRGIVLSLERMRWLPRRLAEPYILVNIPAYHLDLVSGGVDSLSMRVVVGQAKSPTPVFTDLVTYLEVNPTWGLPKRILVEEVLPVYKHDREYFAKHQMRIFYTQGRALREVPPDSVDWTGVLADSFPYIVRQDAGPDNPLGRIKFMCPNEYDVYLHDTPGRGYFRNAVRDLSHGCVRIEDPIGLGVYVLRGTALASRDSVTALIDAGAWRKVGLKHPVPVHVVYWTAWADSDGTAEFRDDLYGIDGRMDAALRARNLDHFELNPKSTWADSLAAEIRLPGPPVRPAPQSGGAPRIWGR